ncbi:MULTISPECIES: hypothetical protein [Clostridium]|uniref:Uncharacterized protein n=1 Tax=Clostridium frigoriphilum TaxID=443253 RepID=A0ABU7UHN4_9CLOT|nr:hypothetical protein [Clostridium sp. DSM 17811]MBU3098386.1 hypothetical protein [Clostridium sp. DSM 17811]
MRTLKTADLFSLSRILKKMNVKKDIKEIAKNVTGLAKEDKAKAEQEMQIDLMMIFIENIGVAEKEIDKLLGDLTGKTAKEIEELGLTELIDLFKELMAQEGVGSFLSQAVK